MWEATVHTLNRHREVRATRYAPPSRDCSPDRSPSVGARDSGLGAFMGRSGGGADPGQRWSAPGRPSDTSEGVRFADARVRPGPLAQSYNNHNTASEKRREYEQERHDFESTNRELNSQYKTPDERHRRQSEQQHTDARAL